MTRKTRTQNESQRSIAHDMRAQLKSLQKQYAELVMDTKKYRRSIRDVVVVLETEAARTDAATSLIDGLAALRVLVSINTELD